MREVVFVRPVSAVCTISRYPKTGTLGRNQLEIVTSKEVSRLGFAFIHNTVTYISTAKPSQKPPPARAIN